MRIFTPRQPTGEARTALTPEVAAALTAKGHAVAIATGAGMAAGFDDDAYAAAGASVVTDDGDGWNSDLIVTVVDTGAPFSTAVLGMLDPFVRADRMRELAEAGATVFAFEAIPRTTRAQVVDALSSQATASGYQATLLGAVASDRFFPMLTTAAGTIRPAKVVVLGAGVAGLQAIATARRLGAVVHAFDVRAAAAEQVKSLGGKFIELDDGRPDAADAGGYAKQLADDAQQRIIDGLVPHLADADVVITTAAIPGRPAPKLIDDDGLEAMRTGAVIVDTAAASGGNTTRTEAGTTVTAGGVTIVGADEASGGVAADASRMYAKNVAAFVELVTGDDAQLVLNWDDDIVAESCIARDGQLVHPHLTAPQH